MLLPINEVPATVTPIDVAIIMKYTGKDLLKAEEPLERFYQQRKYHTYNVIECLK